MFCASLHTRRVVYDHALFVERAGSSRVGLCCLLWIATQSVFSCHWRFSSRTTRSRFLGRRRDVCVVVLEDNGSQIIPLLRSQIMPAFVRSAKVQSVMVTLVATVLLMAFSQALGSGRTSAAADEKKPVSQPPAKEDGSADKKEEPGQALTRFMRQKLQASNLILEGLCTEDLKMVADGSQTLMKMSHEERWRVSNDIIYRRYSAEFIHAVEELQKEAEDNDMDGTSMAWVNVTMKCLKCHEWVRNTVLAETVK